MKNTAKKTQKPAPSRARKPSCKKTEVNKPSDHVVDATAMFGAMFESIKNRITTEYIERIENRLKTLDIIGCVLCIGFMAHWLLFIIRLVRNTDTLAVWILFIVINLVYFGCLIYLNSEERQARVALKKIKALRGDKEEDEEDEKPTGGIVDGGSCPNVDKHLEEEAAKEENKPRYFYSFSYYLNGKRHEGNGTARISGEISVQVIQKLEADIKNSQEGPKGITKVCILHICKVTAPSFVYSNAA